MSMNEKEERLVLWRFIREALPLARITLLAGGVALLDQQAFWAAHSDLESLCDPEEEDLDSPCGINTLIEELMEEIQLSKSSIAQGTN